MTKEQLQLHGEVIKWYIDNLNQGVWRKDHKTKNWHFARNPQFNIEDVYVQNDGYAKFRKALIDGKIIQFRTTSCGIDWIDCKPNWTLPPVYYRIKPETPKFKEGDWVIIKNSDPVEIVQIKTIKHRNALLKGFDEEIYRFFNKDITLFSRDITLWTPKINELCVFWTKENNGYSIKRFNYMSEDGAFIAFDKARYTHAAPLEFIERLKNLR